MLKTLSLTFLLIFSQILFAQDDDVPEKRVEVVLGIDKMQKLDFTPSTKIQIGNEDILTYTLIPSKREITFKGMKPGNTSVTIRNTVGDVKARYLITITATDQSKLVNELKEFLGDVEGLEIGVKGDSVFIGGQIVVPSDIGKVVVVLAKEKFADVLRLVELSPQTQRVIARKMQEEIQKNQLRDVTVRVVNGLFWLEGITTSEGDKTKAELIAKAFVPDQLENLARRTDSVTTAKRDPIQNFITVNAKSKPAPVPKQIKITAQFVELTKDYNKIFGFKWAPLLSDGQGSIGFGKTVSGNVTTRSTNTLSGTISNLFPKLSSAKSAGYARVIQSGIVIVKDKTAGNLVKNEEKPFSIGTGEFQKSEKATAGFNLTVTPTILAEEKIDLNIGLTVSSNVGDPPQTQNNTVRTALIVKSKESAVVGGIVINKNSTDFDRNPPGGVTESSENSSPLFNFIRSKSNTVNKSQFAVFVTPEIIESASQGTDEIKRKFRRRRR